MPAQKKPAVHEPSESEAADDKSEHSNSAAADESLAIVEPSAPAVLPPMFSVGGKKEKGLPAADGHNRGNQHSCQPVSALTKKGAEKRVWGKLERARAGAPQAVKDKWNEITKLKGTRSGSDKHKRAFLMSWVSNPDWSDAYFSQKLILSEVYEFKQSTTWITVGQLEQLIGTAEAAVAVQEK